MRGLLAAAHYLTVIPLGRRWSQDIPPGPAAAWFPVVGGLIGVGLVVVDGATSWLFPPLLAALLTISVWKLVTGGLHLDGLADCLDGLGGRDAAHRLAIMRDSRIGVFGALGLILFLFLEMAALAELPGAVRAPALLLAPASARALPALLAVLFPAARHDGQGAGFAATVTRRAAGVSVGLAVVLAGLLLGVGGLVAVAIAVAAALALAWFLAGRLGGVTGDVMGAAVEVAELAVLLSIAAWTRAPR